MSWGGEAVVSGWAARQIEGQREKQIPRGNDRKKGKGKGNRFDAKGAKVATFRDGVRATARVREETDFLGE
jgi:hypothetical protein